MGTPDKLNNMTEDALLLLTYYANTRDKNLSEEDKKLLSPLFTMDNVGGGAMTLAFLLLDEYMVATGKSMEETADGLRKRLFRMLAAENKS